MCFFLRRRVVSTSPNPQAGGPPLVGCPRLLIQIIHSYLPYRRPLLHPQPEEAPCRGDRDPHKIEIMRFIGVNKHFWSLQTVNCRSQWPCSLWVRLHWSQNRHNTANQHLSGHTLQERVATFNPLKPELNPICYLLALLGDHHFLHVSRIRVKLLTFRLLMSYIWSTHS